MAVLVAVVAMPPMALWRFRVVYLPDRVPSAPEAVSWLTSPDDGRLFLLLLVGAGLVAWSQLIVAIGLELAARLRGTAVPHLPGFGWAQRFAASLLLLMLTATAAEAADEHVVVPGDSLTKIAATDLGNSARYREIFDLNRGIRQPDGRSLRDPGVVRPGWVLQLPHGDPRECEEVVVRPGQTLSQVAREKLGDARRYREIFDLNRGRLQPDGHQVSNPDEIRPGDVLRIPGSPKPAAGGGGAPPAAAFVRVPESCQPPTPPARPLPPSPSAKPSPDVRPPASVDRPSSTVAPSTDADGGSSIVAMSIGGVLAAGLLALLAVRRRRAHQSRGSGQHSRSKEPGKFEKALHVVARPTTVDDLDHALRALARHADGDLPDLRGIKVGAEGIRLQLAAQRMPVNPFVKSGSTEWRLDPSAKLGAEDEPPPYPALVSLGHTGNRDLLLVDLQGIGVLTLDGKLRSIEAVVLAMAWDLAAAPWAASTQVTLVGVGQTSAERHPDRLRYADDWDDVLDLIRRQSDRIQVVLSVIPLAAETAGLLSASGLDAVVTALGDGVELPGAWHLDVDEQPAHVEALAEDVELQQLTPEQASELGTALAEAGERPQNPADEPRAGVTAAPGLRQVRTPVVSVVPRPVPTKAPFIELLGPVRLRGADPGAVEGKKLNRLVELAAYLALHPGVTADEISRQLGTEAQPWSAATRQGYISRLRTWLGRDENDELYVPNVDARRGGYRMSDSFTTDWQVFRDLARRGLADRDCAVSHLQEALNLVRGTPVSNVPPGRYAWSSWLQREMVDAVVEVAHTLAEAYQKADDLPAARRAAMRGLLAEPVSEVLYRDLLRIEYHAGNLTAVRQTADKLVALAASLEMELDQETSTLVSTLVTGRRGT
ncbi:hypothetical protein ACWEVP_03060 [Amycolatopsis sp. NPDC003865]